MVDKKTKKIICTSYDSGKTHDFKLYKKSMVKIAIDIQVLTDTGYQGLQKIHANTWMPKKKSKKNPLTILWTVLMFNIAEGQHVIIIGM